MPWMGPGRRYYYQRERVNGRIVYTYYGAGPAAPLIAEMERLRQERRQHERWEAQMARNEFAELAATPDAIILLLEEAHRTAAATLVEAGYHQHKRGEWRKKRANKDENQSESATS